VAWILFLALQIGWNKVLSLKPFLKTKWELMGVVL